VTENLGIGARIGNEKTYSSGLRTAPALQFGDRDREPHRLWLPKEARRATESGSTAN
jgi:hypothetical protein